MPPFATSDDVEDRIGRDLTDREDTLATSVIATVTGLIEAAADRDSDWSAALDPVPTTLKTLCVEKALSAIANPTNVASQSEQLGAWQHSQTFPRIADVGVFLTDEEERRVRRVVYGSNSATTEPESVVDRLIDLAEGRDVDEDP